MLRIIKRGPKRRENESPAKVTLDKKSLQRLRRLKRRLKGKEETELIALGLKALEQRTDRIIRKMALKRIRSLQRQGRTPEQIARELNRRQFPVYGHAETWGRETVLELLEKEKKSPATLRVQGAKTRTEDTP
jgi:hypothetical protein